MHKLYLKKLILTTLFLLMANVAGAACPSGVCYVRPDGGDTTQCTGGADAPYDGAGTGEACALKHPYYAIGWYTFGTIKTGGQAGKMTGGDDLIIRPGSYKMGYDVNQTWGCSTSNTYDCTSRELPSGTSGDHTRVFGCSITGCGTSTKPELWGSGQVAWVLSAENRSYISIHSLDITDHATCGVGHNLYSCGSADANELSARDGLWVINTNTINITNTDIHGVWRYGLFGGGVSNMTVTDTRIEYNAFGGYNGDHCGGPGCSNSGNIIFQGTTSPFSAGARATISWNGCIEDGSNPFTPVNHSCYSQDQTGYGDGLGINATAGAWKIINMSISHNVSDGLDLLYCTSSCSVDINASLFEGNAGNQVKVPNNTNIEDSLIIGNCGFFYGKSYTNTSAQFSFNNCRAAGNPLEIAFTGTSTTPILNNSTLLSNGDVGISSSGNCPSGTDVLVKNSILLGGREFNADLVGFPSEVSSVFFNSGVCNADFVPTYSICDDWKESTPCLGATNVNNFDPLFSGTIKMGPVVPSGYYSDTDFGQQLYIINSSPAKDLADCSLGENELDFNNFDRNDDDSNCDSGGLEYGSAPEGGTPPPGDICGDNTKDASEVCDGTDLNSQTCVTQGFDSGTLSCISNCNSFDTTACVTYECGNGVIEGSEDCEVGWDVTSASIARWELNDNAASATVIDEEGTYAGTLRADTSNINTSTVTTTGKINEGFTFNGATNDRNVDLGNNFAFTTSDDFSIEAWIKTSSDTEQMVLSKLDADNNSRGWGLDLLSNPTLGGRAPSFIMGNSTAGTDYWIVKGIDFDVSDGAWYHFVVTYDGSNTRTGVDVYINGVESQTYNYSGTTGGISGTIVTTVKALIGARTGSSTDNPGTSFNGVIDNVRIYDRDLTADEVAGLYNAGTGTEGTTGSADLNSQTCITQGFPDGGTLSCNLCSFDTSGCSGETCGNGVLGGSEACDDSNTTNGDGCSEICEIEDADFQHFLANYAETDPNSHLQRFTHRTEITGLNHNESAKVQRDFGIGFFDNFTVKGHYVMNDCTSSGFEDCGLGVFSFSESSYSDLAAQETALDGITLTFAATSNFASKTWKLVINGVLADSAADANPFSSRYPKLTVNGTAVTVNFYSDPNYTTEITDIALSGTYNGDPMRYFALAQSYNSGFSGVSFSGRIENVEVTQGTPEEPPAQGCESTTTSNCLTPTLADSESGGACVNTGTCEYLCTEGVLSVVSNSCTTPVSNLPGATTSITITGQNLTVSFPQ